MDFIKKCIKIAKLVLIYFRRIIFAKNHFKCPWYKKIRANLTRGFLADQWMLYDFDHNDYNEYLSEFDWYRSRYINEPFDFLLNNKIAANEILKQYVRVPEIYAIKSKGALSTFTNDDIDYDYIVDLAKQKGSMFFKPYGAGKGTGVCLITYKNSKLYVDEEEYSDAKLVEFLKKQNNWFVSETMKQHSYSDNIYDKTVNTIRLITLRGVDTQKFKVFFAVQRIGTSATIPVDNGSRGGLVAKIDLDTGILTEARCLHNTNVYKVHPDSKAPIEGAQIPNWDKLKVDIVNLANKMPYMHFIAWDILVTEEGFCIIEGNTSSGVNIIQLWGGQRHGELGDFYRHHKVIK